MTKGKLMVGLSEEVSFEIGFEWRNVRLWSKGERQAVPQAGGCNQETSTPLSFQPGRWNGKQVGNTGP